MTREKKFQLILARDAFNAESHIFEDFDTVLEHIRKHTQHARLTSAKELDKSKPHAWYIIHDTSKANSTQSPFFQ